MIHFYLISYNNFVIYIGNISELSHHRNNALFKLNIINGTIWLSHSGDVRSFSPVLGTPPASSSDMSLASAMKILSEVKYEYIENIKIV